MSASSASLATSPHGLGSLAVKASWRSLAAQVGWMPLPAATQHLQYLHCSRLLSAIQDWTKGSSPRERWSLMWWTKLSSLTPARLFLSALGHPSTGHQWSWSRAPAFLRRVLRVWRLSVGGGGGGSGSCGCCECSLDGGRGGWEALVAGL